MSCITLFTFWPAAPRVREADRCEIVNTNRIEMAVKPKNQLASNWQVVTDETGHRRLEMRWKRRT